jgi:para-nitrobenzyl esterase
MNGLRPVIVFLHGGAFVRGSGAISTYDGAGFARAGVVAVTINYRLGIDGFLWMGEGTANLGLLDQIAALEWVRDNIEQFGGDPKNVTLMGESSGAMSACTLLAVPAASGLFARIIAQSGAARCVLTSATALLVGIRMAEMLKVDATREAIGAAPPGDVLECQLRLAQEIAAEQDASRWSELTRTLMPFEPVVDGAVLPVAPVEALGSGASGDVEILIGTNADEGNFFFLPPDSVDRLDSGGLDRVMRARGYPRETLAIYRRAHPQASPAELAACMMTDAFYLEPALEVASLHANTHLYRFDWRSPAFEGRMGACHALELPFVFNAVYDEAYSTLLGSSPPALLATSMNRTWAEFALTGELSWPRYHHEQPVARIFGDDDDVRKLIRSPLWEKYWNESAV